MANNDKPEKKSAEKSTPAARKASGKPTKKTNAKKSDDDDEFAEFRMNADDFKMDDAFKKTDGDEDDDY